MFLWGEMGEPRNSKSFIVIIFEYLSLSVNYHVYQCFKQPAHNLLHEDGGYLALVQPHPPLHGCAHSHLHGHSQECGGQGNKPSWKICLS